MGRTAVALVQASILRKSPEANLETLLQETGKAGENGASIAVLPELWNVSYPGGNATETSTLKEAEALDAFRGMAKRFGMGIVAGSMSVLAGDGRVNRCHVIGPEGELLAAYDKIHVFSSYPEAGVFRRGSTLGLCELCGWKTGILVCFDVEFPELPRSLAERGAELLVVVGAWPADHIRLWRTLVVVRALENQVFSIGVNRCDRGTLVAFGGHSLVVDPFGEILLQLDDRPATELAWLDRRLVDKARLANKVWPSRRPDLYRKWR